MAQYKKEEESKEEFDSESGKPNINILKEQSVEIIGVCAETKACDGSEDESQFGTQPVQEELENEEARADEELSCNEIWGWLQPMPNSKANALALKNEKYSFGRHPSCDYTFTENDFNDVNTFLALSKTQFQLTRENKADVELVYLHDLSLNGTFVNKTKVGKGCKVLLTANDEISLIFPNTKVFIFVDTTGTRDWLPSDLKKKFSLKILLGSGGFGEVRLALDKTNNKDVAIKRIRKEGRLENNVYNEIKILQEIKHPFIVSLEDVFDSKENVYIVLEYISGGTLKDKIRSYGKLKDYEAKLIFYQLALALEYLHKNGIAHRDLKPENVLLAHFDGGDLVKVTDFGLSKVCSPGLDTELKTACGTPHYIAPEILMSKSLGSYTHQVDIWSLGVSLFFCLSAVHPFSSERSSMTMPEQIIRGSYSITGAEWRGVSPKSISLVRKLLVADPVKRITINDILAHPWFKDQEMKNKVQQLLNNENLCVEYQPPCKQPRLQGTDVTLNKS